VTAPKSRATPGRPAWPELRALAGAARDRAEDGLGDWDPGDVSDAITAVETAGWPFKRALAEVTRMLGDPDARPGGLRAAVLADARVNSGPGLTREEREELRSLALANCEAATEQWKHPGRVTGPQERLTGENDNQQEAS
jgi:hypothetical protein